MQIPQNASASKQASLGFSAIADLLVRLRLPLCVCDN